MYGRSPRLPIDLAFYLQKDDNTTSHSQYAQEWRERMKQAYDIVTKRTVSSQSSAKTRYDRKPASSVLQVGDRVLVRNLSERGGPGKLRNYWERLIHVVVRICSPDAPVYVVQPEQGGRSRTLHRNMLLPCDNLERQPTRQQKSPSAKTSRPVAYPRTPVMLTTATRSGSTRFRLPQLNHLPHRFCDLMQKPLCQEQ